MIKKLGSLHYFVITLIFTVIILGAYVFTHYKTLNTPIHSIELTYGNNTVKEDLPIVYVSSNDEFKIDFKKVYEFQKTEVDNQYICPINSSKKTRWIRLYFPFPNRTVSIKTITIRSSDEVISVPLKSIKEKVGIKSNNNNGLELNILEKNGYIELPQTYIYTADFKSIYKLFLPIILVLLLIVLVVKVLKPINLKPISISGVTLALLIVCIFTPHPVFNIALIILAVFNLKNISWNAIKSNTVNLVFLAFFIVYLLNNLLVSEEGFSEMSTIDRFLPIVILALILPSISIRKYLYLFPIAAFFLGFGFLITSIFDVFIHQNFVFLSFDFFTKYLHPVYFSYLIFLSICFVNLEFKGRNKYILEFVLLLFLIFSGSKMVFVFSLFVIVFNLFSNKKTAFIILPLAVIVILFSPLKQRFNEILKKEDLSVLNETFIENQFDARINGLTLRLILWRETLASMNGRDYIIGKGVSKNTNAVLSKRLVDLGLLEHKSFNPHNQYVDTFWKTGIIGLFFLICIPIFGLIRGIKNKDWLLLQFSLFLLVVMCSESIFGRVNGIYFFTTTMLLLMNSEKINEDSYFRDQRNTQ